MNIFIIMQSNSQHFSLPSCFFFSLQSVFFFFCSMEIIHFLQRFLLLASHGTLSKLRRLPRLNAADVWQRFDLKQPKAKLRLKMHNMTISNPQSCRHCIFSLHLKRHEWQPIVSKQDLKNTFYFPFSFWRKGLQQNFAFSVRFFPQHLQSSSTVERLLGLFVFAGSSAAVLHRWSNKFLSIWRFKLKLI